MARQVNIVLVHGEWADGSSWGKVVPFLNAAGHIVSITQNPLTSLSEDVAITRQHAEAVKGIALLVGHSYGGAVITQAARQCPNVKGLVYISAYAPDRGENLMALSSRTKPALGRKAIHADRSGMLWLRRDKFKERFCQDASVHDASAMAARQKPIAKKCLSDAITSAGWRHLPAWYQVSMRDRIISPRLEQFMTKRMNARKTVYLPASHTPMLLFFKEVANLILSACRYI